MLIHQHSLKSTILSSGQSQLMSSCFLSCQFTTCHFIVHGPTRIIFSNISRITWLPSLYSPIHSRRMKSDLNLRCQAPEDVTPAISLTSLVPSFLSLIYTKFGLIGKHFHCCAFYLKHLWISFRWFTILNHLGLCSERLSQMYLARSYYGRVQKGCCLCSSLGFWWNLVSHLDLAFPFLNAL